MTQGNRVFQVAVAVVAFGVGVVAGAVMGTELGKDGLESLAFALIGGAMILIPGGLVVAALVAWKLRGARGAIATMLTVAVALPIGAMVGAWSFSTAPVPKVALQAPGQAQSDLSGGILPHTASPAGTVTCTSERDGAFVASIASDDLGELGPGTLRGSIDFISNPGVTVEISVDGADLAEGEQLSWYGQVRVDALNDDRSRGRITVDGLILVESSVASGDWPDTLNGTIDWLCEPW
jgi:hypothetical protein